jgi:hypothetical protein|tara:strand:- start:312 stop:725 length:414 start_codon:yes stop_codon:yes gene_type:complete
MTSAISTGSQLTNCAALAWSPDIVMNNVPVAKISSGSIVEIVQPSGNTSIRFKHITFTDPGYNGSMDNFGIDTVVAPGEKQYVIMGPNLDSLIVLPNIASAVSISWGVFEESALHLIGCVAIIKKLEFGILTKLLSN